MNALPKTKWSGSRLFLGVCLAGVALMLCMTGCGLLRSSGSSQKVKIKSIQESTNETGPVDIDVLQQKVMRFADIYATTVAEVSDETAARVGTPELRLGMLRWKLNQATAAFIDASDPNPALNALDMLVLVTLSRMVVEDY